MWSSREATKIGLALGRVGYSDAQVNRWWNHAAYAELGGKTPIQAWNSNEFELVKALVEKLVSERFASALANNPTVVKRLREAQNP